MPMFGPYNVMQTLQNLQDMKERIDKTIQYYQQNQFMPPQQPPITQNFQITPQQNQSELPSFYVDGIDGVKNMPVIKKSLFVDKQFKNLWIKDVNGEIKTYQMNEIVELDEKDKAIQEKNKTIENLQNQINELKGVIMYANQQSNPRTDKESDDGVTTSRPTKTSRNKANDAE